eukprot:UN21178
MISFFEILKNFKKHDFQFLACLKTSTSMNFIFDFSCFQN